MPGFTLYSARSSDPAAALRAVAAALFFAVQMAANGQTAPAVSPMSASNVSSGSATLNASVNPNGGLTTVWFQYGLTTGYGSTTIPAATDNAEGYTSWTYGSNGGTGFGPA